MRKVLCSVGSGRYQELLDLSGETFGIFADRHGYDLDLRREPIDADRPVSWGKIPLFLELFSRYDLVFWIDADAAIVDPTTDIADELHAEDLMGLVAHEYDGFVVPNCGVWVLRRHRLVEKFLCSVWDRTEYLDHDWWENAAVLTELGYRIDPTVSIRRPTRMLARTRLVDRSWNSIAVDPAAHPRVNHYPGRSHEHRLAALTLDLETARAAAG